MNTADSSSTNVPSPSSLKHALMNDENDEAMAAQDLISLKHLTCFANVYDCDHCLVLPTLHASPLTLLQSPSISMLSFTE